MKTKSIPAGYHTLTPHLVVAGAAKAIEFYKEAFNADELVRLAGPDGRSIMHAALQIGDSQFFLVDESPDMGAKSPLSLGGTPVTIHSYVQDVDAAFKQATGAGAQTVMPPSDMFWGDRYAVITDPFGHKWSLAARKEDLTPEEIGERAQAFFQQRGGCA
jgi:PhnB protein